MGEIREAKRSMDLDENVYLFKKAENELQGLLDEIAVIIGHSVSKHIKVPTGNPFLIAFPVAAGAAGLVEAVAVQLKDNCIFEGEK